MSPRNKRFMKFDFETMPDRSGFNTTAYDTIPFENVKPEEGFDRIPMWVADMSFATATPVLEAMKKRMGLPSYGYFYLPDSFYEGIVSWQSRRNLVEGLTKEDIGYENGVLGGVASAVAALTAPGDKILVHSPTYIGFTNTVGAMGRTLVHSPLKTDAEGIWRMDYEDMDRKLKENHIHLAILCSPHNPCGRVWEREELEKAMEVFAANDCYVISDEIWADLTLPAQQHIPTQSVSEDAKNRTIAFYSLSKTFSLAGLIASYHIIYNPILRDRIRKQGNMTHYNACNTLSLAAFMGAMSEEGEQWLNELKLVLEENLQYAHDFIVENFPGVKVMMPQGTYMLYLDCSEYCKEKGITIRELQERGVRCGVIWQDGEAFKLKDSIRMNVALPFDKLEEAMERLKKYAFI